MQLEIFLKILKTDFSEVINPINPKWPIAITPVFQVR